MKRRDVLMTLFGSMTVAVPFIASGKKQLGKVQIVNQTSDAFVQISQHPDGHTVVTVRHLGRK